MREQGPSAVIWACGRSKLYGHLLLLLIGLLASVCLFFMSTQLMFTQRSLWANAVVLAGAVLASAFAWKSLVRMPSGLLCWSGRHWYWDADQQEVPVILACCIELPNHVLLHLTGHDGLRGWLLLEGSDHNPRWMAVRRALTFDAQQAPVALADFY